MGRALLIINTEADRQKAAHWIGKAPWGARITFQAAKRTVDQNSLMWAALTDVAQQVEHVGQRYTPEAWKILFMHACGREVRFLPGLDGKTFVPWGQSSSDLSKQEMTDLIEFIFSWGAEHGVSFNNENPSEVDAPSSDGGSDGSQALPGKPQAVAADKSEPASGGPAEAGEHEAADSQSAPPASVLSPSDKAFLVRVFKTMKAAVGPDTNVFKRQAMVFTDEIGGMSDLVRAKAKTIREQLQECCGEAPTGGTVAAAKYIAGIVGVDEKELAE